MATEIMSSEANDITSSAPRRKSGRVTRKPDAFVPASSPANSAKRKRNEPDQGDVDMDDVEDEEEEEESSEGEPDEEELRERRRAKKGKTAPRRPASKKPKTNGEAVSLAIRPATTNKSKRPRKAPIRKSAVGEDVEGLYAEVFARGHTLNDVAAQWVANFQEHESRAVADVVNFVLKCAGCDIKVDENDIADPDNCANKLGDIQEEYQSQNITDYPLISKAKGTAKFKQALSNFFVALVETIAKSGLLFENVELIENIEVWISTMSSASNRPFRHTATVASLAVISALCEIGKDIVDDSAKKIRQSETEQKKARVNKGRVQALDKEVKELGKRQEILDAYIKDWFDVVFVHRYRDVDPRVRVDCVEALSNWIMTYSDHFFDGTHLRYLGWVLSDTHAGTRLEVVKQLQKLFADTDKLGGLKTFTDRFRPRIVEMATRDAEANVRAASVDLLDTLREAGLLEPDDIDTVGRLVFDAEPRVRKAVVGFFAENVNGTYESQIEDMGGQEAVEEALAADEADENYDSPRIEWLKMKCLVDQLQAYDSEEGELPSQIERISGSHFALVAAGIESRFSLAAQALYDHIPELQQWEVLAGYLLYDHSQTTQNGSTDDVEVILRQNAKLNDRDEIILLDILNAVVKLRLTGDTEAEKHKKAKKSKAQREADQEEQEQAARHLAVIIPRLLKKFGALPEAASSVLNLERVLNLDVFQELRQDATLAALLDDINKQFLTHHNERVLLEASEALRHAQSHEELREVTEGKIQLLWDDTVNTFNNLKQGRDFSTRGSLSENLLTGVSNTVLRIANLAKVSDCTEILEQPPAAPVANSRSKGKQKATVDTEPPISALINIIERGVPSSNTEPETDATEDVLIHHAMDAILPYFMWKVFHWRTILESGSSISEDEVSAIAERRDNTVHALTRVLQSRKGADELRIDATFLLLDLHNAFIVLRQARRGPKGKGKNTQQNADDEDTDDWEALCQEIPSDVTSLLLPVLTAVEKNFAKRARKTLESVDVDDEPVSDDPESESEDEEDDTANDEKRFRTLVAEQRLCELGSRLVMGVLAGTLNGKASGGKGVVRKRLERNKNRLGHDWKEVVNHLDVLKKGGAKAKGAAAKNSKAKQPAKSKSREIVIEDESEEEDPIEDEEQHEEEQGADEEDEERETNGAAERETEEVESVLGD